MNGKTNASDITINQVVNGVLIPLEPATDFTIGSGSGRAYFNWTDPVDKYTTPGDELVSEWGKSVVVRKKDSAPSNIDDGTVVLTETVRNQYQTNQYIDETVDDDTTYYYSVYPVTTTNLVSDPAGGVAVIPMGGEPGFKTYIANLFTMSNDLAYSPDHYIKFAAGANDSCAIFLAYFGRSGNASIGYDYALTLDLTINPIMNSCLRLSRSSVNVAVGELSNYVIFNDAFSVGLEADFTYAYNNDMTRSILSTKMSMGLGRSVTSPSREYVMFAGNAGNDADTNNVEVINNDLTLQNVGYVTDDKNGWTSKLSGTHVGSYYLYGNGFDNDHVYDVTPNMYAWDNDFTKIQNVEPMTINDLDGYGYQVNNYAIFTEYRSAYFETWDSDLTHTPYTSYATLIDSVGFEGSDPDENYIYYSLRDGNCRTALNKQYGSYAMLPISSMEHNDIIMLNGDLSIKRKSISDFSAGLYSNAGSPSIILNNMYIFASLNHRTSDVSLFVLTV